MGYRQRGLAQAQDWEINAFVASLRACAKHKDLPKGTRVHDEILRRGLVKKCSDALVTMYAKCGALAKAKDLFDVHKSKLVFTWTALIAGYAQNGQGRDALHYFEWMQREGVAPDAVTYICILKACGSIGAVDKGEKVHDEIAKQGLLQNNIVLGNALVDMYAKCGALAKAQLVLKDLSARNVVSWNSLIAGYAQQGDGEQALGCYEEMEGEGISPDAVTFTCILKACGSIGAADKGEKIHDKIAKLGLVRNNYMLGSALVDMYAKCGALSKAQRVLEDLPVRNVVSWTALIAGYVQEGKAAEALQCYEQMQCEGISANAVTFSCTLKACGIIKASDKGEGIHEEIAKQGLLRDNPMLGNALVDMYAKSGVLEKARQVLEELLVRDVISWSALITGYVEQCEHGQALSCFEQMQRDGLSPNAVTYISILKACGNLRVADKGQKVHDEISKQGLLGHDIVLGNALVDMYAKCGDFSRARQVLEGLPVRDVFSWNAIITGYSHHGQDEQVLKGYAAMQHEGVCPDSVTFTCILKVCGSIKSLDMGLRVHDEIAKHDLLEKNVVLGTALVNMYAKCDDFPKALQVLKDLSVGNVVSWNVLIAGYGEKGEGQQALDCFDVMQREGLSPDTVTFTCVLKACGSIGAVERGEQIHNELDKQGLLGRNIVLGNALVDMYAKSGALDRARQVLQELPIRDVVSWNALISGYVQQGQSKQALECYEEMQREGLSPDAVTFTCILKACGSMKAIDRGEEIHDQIAEWGLLEKNDILGTVLVDMYARCGALSKARQVLKDLPVQNVVSWCALIAGHSENGQGEQALECFEGMQREGLSPDAATFSCILKACGSIGAAQQGERIHDEVAKQGLLVNDPVLGTALVDMYAKCGALSKAQQLLKELSLKDVGFWNALIAGYAQQYKCAQALECLDWMQENALSPDATTFSSVLSACSRLGQIEDAQILFGSMKPKYGVKPHLEHYTCMVDLFGRAGHIDKAVGVVEKMPFFNCDVWSAMLGACQKWGDVNVGRWAFEHAVQVDTSDPAAYILMVNIYAAAGMVEDAENINMMRVKVAAQKNPQEVTIHRENITEACRNQVDIFS